MRTPPHIDQEFLRKCVEDYLREVKRIRSERREKLREVVIQTRQEKGWPVPEGEEMEAEIDVLEGMLDASVDNEDKAFRFLKQMYEQQAESEPVSASRSRKSRKRRRKKLRKKTALDHRPNTL